MSHTYAYNKKVSPDIIKDMILLDRTLAPFLVNIVYDPENNDYLEIETTEVLDQSTEQILIDIIQAYSSAHPSVIRHNLVNDVLAARMIKGRLITAKISASNQMAGKSWQILFDIYKPENELGVLNMIDSGAFEMAFVETYKMWKEGEVTPNPRWSQVELNEMMRWIELEIGDDTATALKTGVDAGAI